MLRGTLAHEAIEKVFELPVEMRTLMQQQLVFALRERWTLKMTPMRIFAEIEQILLEAEGMCRTWFGVEDPIH